MNFWLSLLIYNPLEAFILLYFCKIFNDNVKIRIRDCYILGTINLLFQYPTMFIRNNFISLAYDLSIALLFSPLILVVFMLLKYGILYIKYAVFSCIFNFCSVFYVNYILNSINILLYTSLGYDCIFSEFVFNLYLRLLQFIFLGAVCVMKKILKSIAEKYTENAFTIMKSFQPKLPKVLKEKLEKK